MRQKDWDDAVDEVPTAPGAREADRPFGCRTFFCERIRGPARQPADTVNALLVRLERVSERLEPTRTSPRPILEWHEEAWDEQERP
ncbi:MAG TPA: hypothetical protein VLQ93_18955 [Myxococcaceae bacterium]|nr:hypothetical protein [Myxococcaceae bacterium]